MYEFDRSKVFLCGMWGLVMTALVLNQKPLFTAVAMIVFAIIVFFAALFTSKSLQDLIAWSRPLGVAALSPLVATFLSIPLGWSGLFAISSSAISTFSFYRWYRIADLS